MRPLPTVAASLLVALALAACASPGPEAPASRPGPVSWDVPARAKLVSGFDAPGERPEIRSFDRVLLGLSLVSPTLSDRWLLDVMCLGDADKTFTVTLSGNAEPRKLATSTSLYLISVLDVDGTSIGQSTVFAPSECLSHGFVAACAASSGAGATLSFDDPHVRGVVAMLSLLATIQEEKVLADILWRVVDKPGLFTFLTTWSTSVTISTEFESATRETSPLDGPWRDLETWSFPFALKYGGKPLMRGRMLVTEPRSPLALTGGLVAMDGYRVSDPETRFELRVLAARRPPPTSRPAGTRPAR